MLDKAFFGRVKKFKFKGSLKRAAKMGQLLVRDGRQSLARDVNGLASDLGHVSSENMREISKLAAKEKEMLVGRSATATAVEVAVKSQLNGLKSAQTELNRAAQAADRVLTDGLGKEVNDVMRETKRFQATTGGVQKDADVETAHIREDAQKAMRSAEELDGQKLERGKQMAKAASSLQDGGKKDLLDEVGRKANAAEQSIASMGARVGAATNRIKGSVSTMPLIDDSKEKIEIELKQDEARVNDEITGAVKKGVDFVRNRQARERVERAKNMSRLEAAISGGSNRFAEDKAFLSHLDEAHMNARHGLDDRVAGSRRIVRRIESAIGPNMLALGSSQDKARVDARREVDEDLQRQSGDGERKIKGDAKSSIDELKASTGGLMNEMHEQRTEGLVLDKEVSQILEDTDRTKVEGFKHATELKSHLRNLLSRRDVNERAMIFGLRASRRRLTESTRRSAAAQVSDAVAEVSRSLGTLITEAENRVGEITDENNSEEERRKGIEGSVAASHKMLVSMDSSVKRTVAQARTDLKALNDSVRFKADDELIRSQHRDAFEGMTESQNRLEKDIAETNGRVDEQHRALKRLADLLKAAMMTMVRHVSGIVEKASEDDHSRLSEKVAAPKNTSAELHHSEDSVVASLKQSQEERNDSYGRLRKALEEVQLGYNNTKKWNERALADQRHRVEKLAVEGSLEAERLSAQLKGRKDTVESINASEEGKTDVSAETMGKETASSAAKIDGEIEKLMTRLTAHVSELGGLLKSAAAAISTSNEQASSLNAGVNREVEEAMLTLNSTWTQMLESARRNRRDMNHLIDGIRDTLFAFDFPISGSLNEETTATIEELNRFIHANLSAALDNTGLDNSLFDEAVEEVERESRKQEANFRPVQDQMKGSIVEFDQQLDIAARSLSTTRQQLLDEIDSTEGELTAVQASLNHELER
ncbi:coiled coil protein, putative [Perkinsus marinus ATCC 50983]|uniref:Coiled coil protein, putative n=1 Tax=Perkinsus marinus (strain ATCC 50983 / TXsc) TaxID=423536 RepID=C5L199_PERM5|nr:coiled coil protein, putative [Perkinsus marinus ATCC 50983]EER09506.1 coiled coil protein, putative [Perkinsus marinus ATCC 50983]|eukprot:XP_002777690.1 coiled coil protein, putative [Perkinsus marinus ATCC 50983]